MTRLGRLRKASFTFKWLLLVSGLTGTVKVWNKVTQRPLAATVSPLSTRNHASHEVKVESPPRKLKASNYAVFNASGFACAELQFLQFVPETWIVLLLHDCAEGTGFKSCPRCISLPMSWVKENVYDKVTTTTPEVQDDPVLTRMSAALYVTSLGASWVFFSDREIPIPFSALHIVINRQQVAKGLMYRRTDHKEMFEPCGHVMDPYTWQGKTAPGAPSLYDLASVSAHTVYHVTRGCVEESQSKYASQEDLDFGAPPAYVQHGTFAVSVLNNLLVPVPQLWALLPAILFSPTEPQHSAHPLTIHSNLSLLVQRILFETEGSLGFLQARVDATPSTDVSRSAAVLSSQARKTIRAQNKLTRFSKWTCPSNFNVSSCLNALAASLTSAHHLDAKIFELVTIWVHLVGRHVSTESKRTLYRHSAKRHVSPVYFAPAPRKPGSNPQKDGAQKVEATCQSEDRSYFSVFPPKHKVTDIVLVVVMNYAKLVSNIPIMNYVYGRHFKHMIYCSADKETFKSLYQDRAITHPVSFIEADLATGLNGYRCITVAMSMGYRVQGFLQASDDVLLSVWNLNTLPRHVPWFQSNFRVAALESESVPDLWLAKEWGPWTSKHSGRVAAINFFQHLQSHKTDAVHGQAVSLFLHKLSNATGCKQCVMYEASDIFFIPAHMADGFHFFFSLMLKYNVHLEIAVPTVLNGLTPNERIYRLRGPYLWYEKRKLIVEAYSERDHFVHPFKYYLLAYEKFQKFFCENYLERLDIDLFKVH